MQYIQKISAFFVYLLTAFLYVCPSVAIMQWMFISTSIFQRAYAWGILTQPLRVQPGLWGSSGLVDQLIGFGAHMISMIPVLLGLFVLRALLRNYQISKFFTHVNACYYRILGLLIFCDVLIAQPVRRMLTGHVADITNLPRYYYVPLGFGLLSQFVAICCGVILILIAGVMSEASKLYDDHQATI